MVGLTATFSAKLERLTLPSRYQALAPPWPPFTERSEPKAWVGSGNDPNWLLKPKLLPGGPPTGLTPGAKKTSCWMSRPARGTSRTVRVSRLVEKFEAVVSSRGTSAVTCTDCFAPPSFSEASTLMSSPARTSISVTDRKSTRLNSSHITISYAVFCLKKKNRRLEDKLKAHNGYHRVEPDGKSATHADAKP